MFHFGVLGGRLWAILNGLCYLATFFLGINSVGLFLYSARLAFNSLMEGDSDKENEKAAAYDTKLDTALHSMSSSTLISVILEMLVDDIMAPDLLIYQLHVSFHGVQLLLPSGTSTRFKHSFLQAILEHLGHLNLSAGSRSFFVRK
ncbi:hypothetical protein D5086_003265 [Populus alba]|uniref:Uncharacterized protein n=1 Tax=Populus alba TaxID=43335 RepID=A0ACC4D434_POPAL